MENQQIQHLFLQTVNPFVPIGIYFFGTEPPTTLFFKHNPDPIQEAQNNLYTSELTCPPVVLFMGIVSAFLAIVSTISNLRERQYSHQLYIHDAKYQL